MSDEAKRFFRCPIGLLARYPQSPTLALSQIVDWAIDHYATAQFGDLDLEQLKSVADAGLGHTGGRKPKGAAELRLGLAASRLNVRLGGGINSVQEGVTCANRFLSRLSTAARNNLVQIRTDWLWSCMHTEQGKVEDQSLSWREFRVLAALLSKIGAKGHKKCGWQEIQARAAGCCGKADFRNLSDEARAAREPLMLSRAQIRSTLDRLESDLFFARYNHGWSGKARESWFSFSMTREELRDKVLNVKVRRQDKLRTFRDGDATAAASKRPPTESQPTANINRKSAEKEAPAANINESRNGDHDAANPPANPPANVVANVVANINKNNSNGNDPNANDSNREQCVKTAAPAFSFSQEEKLRWGEFTSGKDFDGFPFEGCSSVHGKFQEWLNQ